MAQSLTRQIKRGHVVPVFNEFTGQSDFYKRLRNSGLFGITRDAFNNAPGKGPGITVEHVQKKRDAGIKAYMKLISKETPKKPGFLKRLFGKK